MPSAHNPSQSSAVSRLPSLLKKAASDPTVEVVHKLRTTIRRVETSLRGEESSDALQLFKELKKIRKRAGRLRDIDVQQGLLEGLDRPREMDATKVATELQSYREKQEKKIRKLVADELDDGLVRRLRKVSREACSVNQGRDVDLPAIANEFGRSLGQAPLNDSNLHGFRTVTKKLKYRGELAAESQLRDELVAALKKVQDAIGRWHDGVMLSETASKVLGESKRNSLLSLLRAQNRSRFLEALRTVDHARIAIPALFVPARKKPIRSEANPRREAARA